MLKRTMALLLVAGSVLAAVRQTNTNVYTPPPDSASAGNASAPAPAAPVDTAVSTAVVPAVLPAPVAPPRAPLSGWQRFIQWCQDMWRAI